MAGILNGAFVRAVAEQVEAGLEPIVQSPAINLVLPPKPPLVVDPQDVDPNPITKKCLAALRAETNSTDPKQVPSEQLASLLGHKDFYVREGATRELLRRSEELDPTVRPALVGLLKSSDPEVVKLVERVFANDYPTLLELKKSGTGPPFVLEESALPRTMYTKFKDKAEYGAVDLYLQEDLYRALKKSGQLTVMTTTLNRADNEANLKRHTTIDPFSVPEVEGEALSEINKPRVQKSVLVTEANEILTKEGTPLKFNPPRIATRVAFPGESDENGRSNEVKEVAFTIYESPGTANLNEFVGPLEPKFNIVFKFSLDVGRED